MKEIDLKNQMKKGKADWTNEWMNVLVSSRQFYPPYTKKTEKKKTEKKTENKKN